MHGVKRLFGWMIPRFDRDRFRVSLVSLRKKDLSEETLEQTGRRHHLPRARQVRSAHAAGAAERHRSQADRRPAPPRLRRDDVRPDGRRHPAHSDHPARARQPDRHPVVSEGRRSGARAVHRHRAGRLAEHRRLRRRRAPDRRLEGEGRVPRRPARGVQPAADGGRDRRAPARELGIAPGSSRSAPSRGCTIRRATRISSTRPRRWCVSGRRRGSSWSGEGPLLGGLQAQAAALGLGDRFVFAGFRRDVARHAVGVRPQRVSVAVGRDADYRVRGAGDGQADRLHRCRRPARHPHPRSRCVDRPEARRGGAGRADHLGDGPSR